MNKTIRNKFYKFTFICCVTDNMLFLIDLVAKVRLDCFQDPCDSDIHYYQLTFGPYGP